MSISEKIRHHPVMSFYILAFSISWAGYLPQLAHSHGFFPFESSLFFIIGGLGPAIAAFIVTWRLHDKKGLQSLIFALGKWKVNGIWHVIALFLPLVTWLIVLILPFGVSLDVEKIIPLFMVVPIFLVNVLMNVWEEIGWRGFALPTLQSRHDAVISSLIIGFMWATWHLPLLLMKNYPMSRHPLLPFFLDTIMVSILYTWLYNHGKGSLLLVTMFHAAANTTGFMLESGINDLTLLLTYKSVVLTVLVIVVVLVFGHENLSRSCKKVTFEDLHPSFHREEKIHEK